MKKFGDESYFFNLEVSLNYQAEHLAEWKTKLNEKCYNDLEAWAIASNEGKIDPYTITRGSDLSNFIANWKAK